MTDTTTTATATADRAIAPVLPPLNPAELAEAKADLPADWDQRQPVFSGVTGMGWFLDEHVVYLDVSTDDFILVVAGINDGFPLSDIDTIKAVILDSDLIYPTVLGDMPLNDVLRIADAQVYVHPTVN